MGAGAIIPILRLRQNFFSCSHGIVSVDLRGHGSSDVPNESTACALWRRSPAELRVNDDRAIRRRASRVRRPTRARATRDSSYAPKADSSLPSRSRSSSGRSRSTRSQDNRNSHREQMQPRASSLARRPRPDRQLNL
jgi:hypothetical protein